MLSEKREFNNEEGGHESPENPIYQVNGKVSHDDGPIQASLKAINTIRSMGKEIILVYPIPEVGWEVPKALRLIPPKNDDALSTSYAVYKKRTATAFRYLDQLPADIKRIYPDTILCESATQRCYSTRGLKALYYDDDHLSPMGAYMIIKGLEKFPIQ